MLLSWSPNNQQVRIGVPSSSQKPLLACLMHIFVGHRHPDKGPSLQSSMRAPPVIVMIVFLPYAAMHLPHNKQGLTLLLN